MSNNEKSNMADVDILKIGISPYLSCESSKIDAIWYANATFDLLV